MTDARKNRRSFLKLTAATGGVAGTMIVTGRASAQTAGDPAKAGDLLLHQDGPNKGKAVKASELKVGVAADPKTKNPHDPLKGGVVLVKLASGRIQASSKPSAAGDVVSYSAICTHQGCPIKEIGTIGGGTGNIISTCLGAHPVARHKTPPGDRTRRHARPRSDGAGRTDDRPGLQSRRAVRTYLQALRRETGLSLLLTTHQIEEAEDADLVAIIDRGKVLAFGTPQSLREGLGKVMTLQGVPDDVRAGLWQGVPDTVMDEVGDTLRLRMADPARSWRTSLRICRA